jgi:hypothetical protein
MLAQLLGKHGLGAEVAGAHRITRGGLDTSGFAMICVAYLEVNGSPTHLRYLLRRLRARCPGLPLLVGIWPTEDPTRADQRLRTVVGADHYAGSLREAVGICLDIAAGRSDIQATAA